MPYKRIECSDQVRRRLQAATLFKRGVSPPVVADELGVPRQTAYRWQQAWKAGGAGALRGQQVGAKPKLSRRQLNRLESLLVRRPKAGGFEVDRWTLALVVELIRSTFGISYTASHVRMILVSRGWEYRRKRRSTAGRLRWLPPGGGAVSSDDRTL